MQQENRFYVLIGWMGIVPLVSSAGLSLVMLHYESVIAGFGLVEWALFFVLAVFTMAFAITPTTFLALVSGFFLGVYGLLPMVLAYQAASIVGYFLARQLGADFLTLLQRKYPGTRDIVHNVHKNQFALTFLSRISPAFPFAIMNVVLSVSKISLSPFFWGGLVGMLPRTLFFLWIGASASEWADTDSQGQNGYVAIGVSLLVLYAIYKILFSRKTR